MPRNHESSPKNSGKLEFSGAVLEEKKNKKTFIFIQTKPGPNEKKSNYFEPIEEESANYNENIKEAVINKGGLQKKSSMQKVKYESPTNFQDNYMIMSEKSPQFNKKTHIFSEPITPISSNFSEKSRINDFLNSVNKQSYFNPRIKKNGEAHNFHLQTKTESPSNLKETHKDFSKYGQFIAYEYYSPTLKTNSLYSKINERINHKTSKSAKVDEEFDFSPTLNNNTLYNASTSVLSNINWGTPSYVLNRQGQGFISAKNDENVNFQFLAIFYFFLEHTFSRKATK